MKPEAVQILSSLHLTAEQWSGVMMAFALETERSDAEQHHLSSLTDLLDAVERIESVLDTNGPTVSRHKTLGAERTARWRARHKASQVTSQSVTSNVTERHGDGKESFPHTPFKENTSSNLTVVRSSPPTLPPQPSKPDDAFERFWAIYPPREGGRDKAAARKAFPAALRRADLESILDGAARYRAYLTTTNQLNTRYVKQARTWLNGNGWQENYDVAGNIRPVQPNSISGGFDIIRGALAAEERAIREEEQRLRLGRTNAQIIP